MIDFNGENEYTRGLIEAKCLPSFQSLGRIVSHLVEQGMPCEEIQKELEGFSWNFNLMGVNKGSLIDLIIKKGKVDNGFRGSFEDVTLYETEINYLKTISDETVRKILYLSLIISKWNNHPSGWIRYDRDSLFDFWGMKHTPKEKKQIMTQCCRAGMDLRVIGSKNPVICFRVNFRFVDATPLQVLYEESDIRSVYQQLFGGGL